ncbi:MAG: ACT domain-containing protein [Dehalococcoidia bacterium]
MERLVECDWGPTGTVYVSNIEVVAWDRPGLLRDLSALVASQHVNIAAVRHDTAIDGTITVRMTLETEGLAQLAAMMSRLESVRGVAAVNRIEG